MGGKWQSTNRLFRGVVEIEVAKTGAPQWVSNDGCKSLSFVPKPIKNRPIFLVFLKVYGKLMGGNEVVGKSTGAIAPIAPAMRPWVKVWVSYIFVSGICIWLFWVLFGKSENVW